MGKRREREISGEEGARDQEQLCNRCISALTDSLL